MQSVLKTVDLVLFDVKHLDSGEHQRTTGAANKIILKNLHKAAAVTSTWLRIPLIAGFNDSEEHIENIARLARQIGACNISLLTYHQGGQSKKEQLGQPYTFTEGRAPGEEHVQRLKRLIERTGTPASIDK
jgi:pyruvate formate lyase activating enzyme